MARMIRWHQEEFIHFVTNRTQHRMFFLLPVKEIKRTGTFWEREYDDLIVDGEVEFLNRIGYIAANPVEAGLVATPGMWGGVTSVHYALGNQPVVGKGLDVTGYNNATRFGRKADRKKFEDTYSFELTPLPMLRDKSSAERCDYLKTLIGDAGREVRMKRGATKSMGMEKVRAQSPFDSPRSSANKPRFKFMSFCKERAEELQQMYQRFVGHYRSCMQQLFVYYENAPAIESDEKAYIQYVEKAPQIIWPHGCFVPSRHLPIGA
jgi:hypothetical protein